MQSEIDTDTCGWIDNSVDAALRYYDQGRAGEAVAAFFLGMAQNPRTRHIAYNDHRLYDQIQLERAAKKDDREAFKNTMYDLVFIP